jgi:hypothetical protein
MKNATSAKAIAKPPEIAEVPDILPPHRDKTYRAAAILTQVV